MSSPMAGFQTRPVAQSAALFIRRSEVIQIGMATGLDDLETPRRKRRAPSKTARKKIPRRTHCTVREARIFRREFRELYDALESGASGSSSEDAKPTLTASIKPSFWRRLSKNERTILFGLIASKRPFGTAYAFSANLDPRRFDGVGNIIAKINTDLNRALNKRGLSEIAYVIGLHCARGDDKELHLHGTVLISSNAAPIFMAALISICGVWRPDGRRERQTHCEPRYGVITWERYIIEPSAATRRHLLDDLKCTSGRTITMSWGATRIVKSEFMRVTGFTASDLKYIAPSVSTD